MRARVLLSVLFGIAGAHYAWNAAAQPGFWGYDEGGHAAYALAILETGALPDPFSGWSTFHPPVYYLLAAASWALLEPLGPGAVLVGLRVWSALGVMAAAAVTFALARRLAGSELPALTAAALVLFVPVAQLAATMVGNEGLAAGFAALSLLFLVRLQGDPGRMRSALLAGGFAGLALATKFTGVWVLAACAVPFARGDLGTEGRRALAACFAIALAVAGPVYVRNLVLTDTPFPLTRTREPMKRQEASLQVRERRLADYLTVPLRCGQYPYVAVVAEGGSWAGLNPAMQSVPCLTYAGVWFDPFGLRALRADPAEGLRAGRALLWAGLVPSLLVLLGFGRALSRAVRSRGRDPAAPLVAVSVLALLSYAGITWMAPSLGAAKASYLLPALAPAGVFLALGAQLLGRGVRGAALALTGVALALALFVFTTGTVFRAADPRISYAFWMRVGAELPRSFITETAARLLAPAAATGDPDRRS